MAGTTQPSHPMGGLLDEVSAVFATGRWNKQLIFSYYFDYRSVGWSEASMLRCSSLSDWQCQVFHLLPGRLTLVEIARAFTYFERDRYGLVIDVSAISYSFGLAITREDVGVAARVATRALHGRFRFYVDFCHGYHFPAGKYRRSYRVGELTASEPERALTN
jgi:hypothetical protein